MQITLLPSHKTPYTNVTQAVRHLAKITRGKPFKLQLTHLGRTQVNEYTGTGDFIRSTTH